MADASQFIDPSQVTGLVDDFDVKRGNASRGSIGRAPGVTNYNPDKLQILLEIVQEFVPTNDEEWDLVTQKFNQTFHNGTSQQEDRMMKSLKRKFSELVSGGTKTTSHDLTHFVNWAKKLSLRIREKTTGKPYSEPVENSGLIMPSPGDDDDASSAGGIPWGANALGLPSPSLAPRIRKNRLSAGGSGAEFQHVLSYLQMQSNVHAQNHQQVLSLLQQVVQLLTPQQQQQLPAELSPHAAALPLPAGINKVVRGRKSSRDEDAEDEQGGAKRRKHSEGEDVMDDNKH